MLVSIMLLLVGVNGCGKRKNLSCSYEKGFDNYLMKLELNFGFEDNKIKTYEDNRYMKFNSETMRDNFYKQLNALSGSFKNIDGLTYKLSINEENELKQLLKIENVASISNTFESFMSEFSKYGKINENTTKDEIKEILEKSNYVCK